MVEILLLILKIIGIILLCVIGLIVLILLIVSWVPIRYGADFSKYEKLDLSVYVTWFLKIVSFEFFLKGGTHGTRLKLFGKALGSGGKPDDEAPSEAAETDQEKAEASSEEQEQTTQTVQEDGTQKPSEEDHPPQEKPPDSIAASSDADSAEQPADTESDKPSSDTEDDPSAAEEVSAETHAETANAGSEETESVSENTVSDEEKEAVPFDERLDDILYGLQEKYISLEDQWEGIRDKYEFLTDPHAMREYRRIFRNIGKILKHLMPDKLSGRLHYGLDSPALTGKILAYYCAAAPIHKYSLIPEPDFTEKVIEGEAHLKSRIFIGYLIIKVLAIALNRDVLYLLLNFRKHFRKSQEG